MLNRRTQEDEERLISYGRTNINVYDE